MRKPDFENNLLRILKGERPERAYSDLKGKIAVLGGIDINYLMTETPEHIYARCRNMLELSEECGGYALGSGNSISRHMPQENYFAMLRAAWDMQ